MKKIYLCALALSIGSLSFGQRATAVKQFGKARLEAFPRDVVTQVKGNNTDDKAAGAVIWSEDFAGGFPTGWTKGGTTNSGNDWVINSAAIAATYTSTGPILSTSGGNHMLYFGETINPIADRDAYFQTSAIALTGQPSVSVQFQQKFRLCCTSANLSLVVSTDSTFPTSPTVTQTYNVTEGVAINAMSADPQTTSVNISNLVAGYTGNIYLRFYWAGGASHYFWMVDDIKVMESNNNDLITFDPYYGFNGIPYTRIPTTQIQAVDFSMQTTNVGGVDQTNTILTANVDGSPVGTSAAVTVPTMTLGATVASVSDSLGITGAYTPTIPTATPHTIMIAIASDSTDITPSNNSFTFSPFELTDTTYALDDYGQTFVPGNGGGVGPGGASDVEYEAGNLYDAVTNDVATSITVVIGTNAANVGQTIDVVLYSIDATGNFVEVTRSGFYTVTAADTGNAVTLTFTNPTANPALTAGTEYFAAVHTFTEFYYGTSGSSPGTGTPGGQTSFIFYPNMVNPTTGENFYTSRTPMIRLNVQGAVNVSELSKNVNFSVYPNPSTDIFNINLTANTSENVTLSVRNIVGQTILTKQLTVNGSTKESISLANYDKGIYFLTIDSNKERKTVKLIVE